MMSRDKLRQIKSRLRQGIDWSDPNETSQLCHSLVDSNLEALGELEGGQSTQEQRADLAERERQVKLALVDVRVQVGEILDNVPADLRPAVVEGQELVIDLQKLLYTVDLIEEMLKAKGPKWKNEWQWYAPRIEEEFGVVEESPLMPMTSHQAKLKTAELMAQKLIELNPEESIDDLPQCTNPVGSLHDWLPASAGVVRCAKCPLSITMRVY